MSLRHTSCPCCDDSLLVRVEQIISGRRVTQAFYCGRCDHEWEIIDSPVTAERRRKERRTDPVRTLIRKVRE